VAVETPASWATSFIVAIITVPLYYISLIIAGGS